MRSIAARCWLGFAPALLPGAPEGQFVIRVGEWNEPGLLAFTRLAELRSPVYADGASDALLWIGTRSSLQTLLDARAQARARGIYNDPSLARGGYDLLANDSSAVLSRTGRWLTDWIRELRR
jgi:hypothetical protein